MKIADAFPSKYLKTSDLQGERRTVILASVVMESVSQDPSEPEKPVAYFKGAKKGLVLNRTNCMAIAELYGDESDDWIGKPVVLAPSKTPFQGKLVDCVRVEAPPKGKPKPRQPVNEDAEDPPELADDIGF